ncbi:Lrp/AsnC family transcriptional regulator [Candidatus Bathyarchaeota archaeon]|nr:Lrp/AsnC family transcriptional regulator [Candidatus Bathyarchaeota archaeon]
MKRKSTAIDKVDVNILSLIYKNPGLTYTEIAEKLKTTPVTIHNRIKKMKEKEVLKEAIIIPPKIFGKNVTAFVQVSVAPGQEKNIGESIAKIHEVLEVVTTTGDFDLLIKIVASDVNELQQIIMDKIRGLKGVIRTNTILLLSTLKSELNYIPRHYL